MNGSMRMLGISQMKHINIAEFRSEGFLQELNRQFLHPLGLAMEIAVDDDGNESISGIQDHRDDPEGVIYDIASSDSDRIRKFSENEMKVMKELLKHAPARTKLIGSPIENIPTVKLDKDHVK